MTGHVKAMKHMQWSKLRTAVESYFADSVKGRVGLHSTRYRTSYDEDGRAWITLDGRQVVNMPLIWVRLDDLRQRALELAANTGASEKEVTPEAEIALMNEGKFMQPDLGRAMHDYLSMSMSEILDLRNPIIRVIGMLDRRLGRRRRNLLGVTSEHRLVEELYDFRKLAEAQRSRQRGSEKADSDGHA